MSSTSAPCFFILQKKVACRTKSAHPTSCTHRCLYRIISGPPPPPPPPPSPPPLSPPPPLESIDVCGVDSAALLAAVLPARKWKCCRRRDSVEDVDVARIPKPIPNPTTDIPPRVPAAPGPVPALPTVPILPAVPTVRAVPAIPAIPAAATSPSPRSLRRTASHVGFAHAATPLRPRG